VKRYLFSILLSIFAFGGILAGYLYYSIDHLPKYKLLTIQGDPIEGKNINLYGSYDLRVFSEAMTVSDQGSKYRRQDESFRQNILDIRSWFFNHEDIQQLVQKHRQFMRSKGDVEGFYNDDDQLIYVDAKRSNYSENDEGIELKISRLHKLSKLTKEYTIHLSEAQFGFTINDVQLVEGQLHILMTTYLPDAVTTRMYDHIVDLSDGSLINSNHLQIDHIDAKENHYFSIRPITEQTNSAPSTFVVLFESENKMLEQGDNNYSFDRIAQRYYAYSYQTLEIVPLLVTENDMDTANLYDHKFTYAVYKDNEFTISTFDLNTKEVVVSAVTLENLEASSVERSMQIKGDRLFTLIKNNQSQMLAAIDTKSGDIVYKGELVFDGKPEKAEEAMNRIVMRNIGIR